ncbi:hypothetical protein PCANC_18715 [Puccinia coronata f. sp. avenae]|nr:hypothetical protein PCANC_18715 [Puccinia coronata f. sp. avenae]
MLLGHGNSLDTVVDNANGVAHSQQNIGSIHEPSGVRTPAVSDDRIWTDPSHVYTPISNLKEGHSAGGEIVVDIPLGYPTRTEHIREIQEDDDERSAETRPHGSMQQTEVNKVEDGNSRRATRWDVTSKGGDVNLCFEAAVGLVGTIIIILAFAITLPLYFHFR